MQRTPGRITAAAMRDLIASTMDDPQAKTVMYEPRDFDAHGGVSERVARQSRETQPSDVPPSPNAPQEGEPARVVMEFSLWTPNRTVAQFIGMALLRDVFGVVNNDMSDDEFEAVCRHWEVVGPLHM